MKKTEEKVLAVEIEVRGERSLLWKKLYDILLTDDQVDERKE